MADAWKVMVEVKGYVQTKRGREGLNRGKDEGSKEGTLERC